MAEAVKVEGLNKLTKELKALDTALPKRLKAVSKDAAELVAVEARAIVPEQTGLLGSKIRAGATVKGGDVRVKGPIYNKVIHFGWPRHNITPQPFLYEALDRRAGEVAERFNDGVAKLLAEIITPGTGGVDG